MKRALVLAVLAGCAIAALPPSRPPAEPAMFGEGVFSTPSDEFGAAIAPGGAYAFFNRSIPLASGHGHRRHGDDVAFKHVQRSA